MFHHKTTFRKKQIQAILLPMTGCLPTLEVNINKNCMEVSKNYFLDYSNDKNIKTIIIATTCGTKNYIMGQNSLMTQIIKYYQNLYLV